MIVRETSKTNNNTSQSENNDQSRLAPPERQAQLDEMYQMLVNIGLEANKEEQSTPAIQLANPVPLTLISGFLGAGKTTVLNELLSGNHGLKLAVIVNDFGSVNIDASLIKAEDSAMISLENGCICCSSSGQLTEAIDSVIEFAEPPDAIVVEASGVADPQSTAFVAMANKKVKLDGIVTVVDAETLLERIGNAKLADLIMRQITVADVVLLNKTDIVGDKQLSDAQEWVRTHVPKARLVTCKFGEVPAAVVIGVGDSQFKDEPKEDKHPVHHHDEELETWTFTSFAPLDRDAFRAVIESLPESVVRAKGILQLSDEPNHRTIFQLVGKRWEFTSGESWEDEALRQSNVVLIGLPGSISDELRESFEDCLTNK
jgi:G3E family GTPase